MKTFDLLTVSIKVVFILLIAWTVITFSIWIPSGKSLGIILKAQMDYVIKEAESVRIFE